MIIDKIIRYALDEDLGRGDITSRSIIPEQLNAEGYFIAKSEGILAGREVVEKTFEFIDPDLKISFSLSDGDPVNKGTIIGRLKGKARSILAGERVALNFLQHLSGIATATSVAVKKARPYGASITDTRKTTPGLRVLEKYAVTVGGGKNHRLGLDDAILIKDNHIKIAGSVGEAIKLAKENTGHMVKIEVEVEIIEQVKEALDAGVDVIMLDNMSIDEMKQAVNLIGNQALVEASGGITLETVSDIASCGVNIISLGWLTHSAQPLDISLEIE